MEQFDFAFLKWLVSVAIPVMGMYLTNRNKIKETEHRMTVLEMKVEQAEHKTAHNAARLDEHDEQQRTMYAMVEQIRTLTTTVSEIRQDVKKLMTKE